MPTNPDGAQAGGELKPCPYCGDTKAYLSKTEHDGNRRYVRYNIECGECVAAVSDCETPADAVAAWNNRAEQPQSAGGGE